MVYDQNEAIEKASKIKIVILDVHGVLTSGHILYNDEGVKFQTFSHDDGFGANMLMMMGIEVSMITRKSKTVAVRCEEIGVKRFYQAKDKAAKCKEIMEEMGITAEEVCFVGDEIIDMGVMRLVGFAVAPANAVPEVKEISHYVTTRKGGEGVLRELGEFILRAQGKWKPLVDKVGNKGWG
ncbi:MAG: phenylphosphate carboxylase subunit delta [Deltaproteobacteria bacterium]|nr:MAG: phenylphosphate carboxylase subunit delta [Deltaproteobacteria bacterium]